MPSYFYLSKYYDSLTGNVDYKRRADFLVEKIGERKRNITILDAGCGTGNISRLLLDSGMDVIGVDNSPEMLSLAREKNPEQLLLCQDLTELDLFGTVQCVICLQDTLNHLNNLNAVVACIKKFSLFLEAGCLLFIDTNTLYKHKVLLNNNAYVYETDDVFCSWRNQYNCKDNSINMVLDLFSTDNGNIYYRNTEVIREIYIPLDWLKDTLYDNGFIVEEIIDGDSYQSLNACSERIMIIARKRK